MAMASVPCVLMLLCANMLRQNGSKAFEVKSWLLDSFSASPLCIKMKCTVCRSNVQLVKCEVSEEMRFSWMVFC